MDKFERESFVFYRSFFEAIKDLDSENQAILFCAVCELALNGVEVELDGINKTIFKLIKPQILANNRRFVNGSKGGAPKGNKNASKQQKQPKNNLETTKKQPKNNQKQPNVNVNDNVNEECKCIMSNEEHKKIPYQEIINFYNEICSRLPKVTKNTENRKKAINARFKEYGEDVEVFKTLFAKANESDFLCGMNNNHWSANFDWLLKQQNMAKVLEDRYINKEAPKPTIPSRNIEDFGPMTIVDDGIEF